MKKLGLFYTLFVFAIVLMNPICVKAESEWSEWDDEEPVISTRRYEQEERLLYQYRDKSHTTSNSSSMEGWEKEKDPTVQWGTTWSNWQDAKVTSSATRKVETKQVVASYKTQYRYWRWVKSNNYSYGHFCYSCAVALDSSTSWVKDYTGWQDSAASKNSTKYYCSYASHGTYYNDYAWVVGGRNYWYQETQQAPASYKTQYRYLDGKYVYYYYKWSDWSEWDEIEPETVSDREVQTKTQYRYKIIDEPMENITVSGIEEKYSYTGDGIVPEYSLAFEDIPLVEGEDYSVEYINNVDAGTATIIFKGQGTYTDSIEKTYAIVPVGLSDAKLSMDNNSYTYTGSYIEPDVKVVINDKKLVKDKDYEVIYSHNVSVGTADVVVTGKGNYEGTVKTSFTIVAAPQVIVPQTPQPTTEQVTTEAARQTANAGTVTLVTMDEQEETGAEATSGGNDSKVKIKKNPGDQSGGTGSSSNKVAKGTVFESKKAEYKVTDTKNKSVVYMNSNAKKASSVKVPDTIEYKNKTYKVTQIAPNAFKGNKKLTKLVIGKNVKKIGKNAFRGCKKLKSVTFGKNVVSIGAYAFYGDKKLTTINFGTKKLNKVGKAAFKNISKHPTAKVPKEKIGKYQKLIKKAI